MAIRPIQPNKPHRLRPKDEWPVAVRDDGIRQGQGPTLDGPHAVPAGASGIATAVLTLDTVDYEREGTWAQLTLVRLSSPETPLVQGHFTSGRVDHPTDGRNPDIRVGTTMAKIAPGDLGAIFESSVTKTYTITWDIEPEPTEIETRGRP